MRLNTPRSVALLLVVVPLAASAQLAVSLPKVHAVTAYFEPAVLWIPSNDFTPARFAGMGFGVETSFETGAINLDEPSGVPPFKAPADCRREDKGVLLDPDGPDSKAWLGKDRNGQECRICYADSADATHADAFGGPCKVEKEADRRVLLGLAVGYAQRGTWGQAPLSVITTEQGRLPLSGTLRSAPSVTMYFTLERDGASVSPYIGPSLGLAIITQQFSAGGTALATLTGTTLAPGLHLGITFNRLRLYAELAYEAAVFGGFDYKLTGTSSLPEFAPTAFSVHTLSLRLGAFVRVQE